MRLAVFCLSCLILAVLVVVVAVEAARMPRSAQTEPSPVPRKPFFKFEIKEKPAKLEAKPSPVAQEDVAGGNWGGKPPAVEDVPEAMRIPEDLLPLAVEHRPGKPRPTRPTDLRKVPTFLIHDIEDSHRKNFATWDRVQDGKWVFLEGVYSSTRIGGKDSDGILIHLDRRTPSRYPSAGADCMVVPEDGAKVGALKEKAVVTVLGVWKANDRGTPLVTFCTITDREPSVLPRGAFVQSRPTFREAKGKGRRR